MLSNAIDFVIQNLGFWLILFGLIAVATILGEWWERKGRCL